MKTPSGSSVPMSARLPRTRTSQVVLERIAFQIWWLIQSSGGDCTYLEMSELTEASIETCRNICARRGWVVRGGNGGQASGAPVELSF